MIVAIDGPAGAGKSTVARRLAKRLGFRYLDTGAMYRALTWLALEHGTSLDDEPGLAVLAQANAVTFDATGAVAIGGRDVTEAIRGARIDRVVSTVARHPQVRAVMRERQQELAEEGDAVIEGRDIGTVVAPDAELKLFLDASPRERARRRAAQLNADAEEVLAEQSVRDERDRTRTDSPLLAAPDATVLDTTGLSVDEVVERIAALAAKMRS
jgi:CMP/dCMP kinase